MRLSVIAVGIILMSANAYANTNIGQQLSICAAETDKSVRLTCYDALAVIAIPKAKMMETTTADVVKIEASSTTVAPVIDSHVEGINMFGLIKKSQNKQIDKIYLEVFAVKKGPYGELIITLINGQVWKQISPEHYRVAKGQRIFITAGALNSFLLGSDDRNSTTRVRRLK
ncbi:hypothetical protein [Shewanella frigidimarina]|uniref:Uncharacterized protein n=1 Tax=Shewanella frigidimarina TaxID=56812 RepID=A0A119CYR4_SHEFR|nr:hypothetical protein [Shewanella frigidimarina]KVX00174.1 hypothetical protein AWJ07_08775 [Shewanella frigidimarina]